MMETGFVLLRRLVAIVNVLFSKSPDRCDKIGFVLLI